MGTSGGDPSGYKNHDHIVDGVGCGGTLLSFDEKERGRTPIGPLELPTHSPTSYDGPSDKQHFYHTSSHRSTRSDV